MNKKILVINGNSKGKSFSDLIEKSYTVGAKKSGHKTKVIRIRDLKFNPIFNGDYSGKTKVEKDIKKSQDLIQWADHILIIYPVWWSSVPALLKGWMDNVFLPGFAFKYEKGKSTHIKLLKGKTASVIKTSGGPWWVNGTSLSPDNIQWKYGIFNFTGIKLKKTTNFSNIRSSISKEKIEEIKSECKKLAMNVK